jgi:hypothetical protein
MRSSPSRAQTPPHDVNVAAHASIDASMGGAVSGDASPFVGVADEHAIRTVAKQKARVRRREVASMDERTPEGMRIPAVRVTEDRDE